MASQISHNFLPFTKMHGLGNDFVMVKDSHLASLLSVFAVDDGNLTACLSNLARNVCDRRTGVGGDGLIVAVQLPVVYQIFQELIAAYPSYSDCNLAWIYINSDGSSSDMCGNGLRCLSRFAQEKQSRFRIATRAYPVDVTVHDDGETVSTILAAPRFGTANSTTENSDALSLTLTSASGDITLSAIAVDMGNPHCVIFDCEELNLAQYQNAMRGISSESGALPSLEKFPPRLLELAQQIQSLALFPQGVNVEFVLPESKSRATVFVVERGCGPTLACASGAAAVVAAGAIEERLNRQCCVILPGGELEVAWSSEDKSIELRGPAQIVFAGEYPISGASFFAPFFPVTGSCFEELPA